MVETVDQVILYLQIFLESIGVTKFVRSLPGLLQEVPTSIGSDAEAP